MRKNLSGISLIALVVWFASLVSGAYAQAKPLKKIHWGVTSLSASNWIPWLRRRRRFMRDTGSMSI